MLQPRTTPPTFQDMILTLQHYWSGARLRHPPAVRRRGRGGDVPPRDRASRARPRTVARRLCPAEPAAVGRALRRQPQPARCVLPVPGHPQAVAARHHRRLSGQPRRDRHRRHRPRHPLRRGRLGKPDARRMGARLGSLVRRHGSQRSSPISSRSAASTARRSAARSPMASSGWRRTSRARIRSTTSPITSTLTYGDVFRENEREFSAYSFTGANTDLLFKALRRRRGRVPRAGRRRPAAARPTTRRSRRAICSTCSTPAASSASPSARRTSAGSAT